MSTVSRDPSGVGAERIIAQPPLVVDVDGTLLKTDLLVECVFALLRKHPLYLFVLPVWLLRGRAWFKQQVARQVSLDANSLPWRTDIIDYLKRQRSEGRTLVLATGGDIRIARMVADHLNLFDSVLASDGMENLRGATKRDHLVSLFGEKGFDYVADGDGGGGRCDLTVWASARRGILVNPTAKLHLAAARLAEIDDVFMDRKRGVATRLKSLRLGHWMKNLLVFVPLVAAHRFYDLELLEMSLLAFLAFGFCASSGYLFNDLIDLESDRRHPQKRFRPFAAGDLPLSWGLVMIPSLLILSCLLSALISMWFVVFVLSYFAMSAAYSLSIKKIAILDVLFLAGLYTLRIMAGSAAVGIWSSHWLLAFSTFLFFSLALVKRYAELVIMKRAAGNSAKARAYESGDEELLASMGTASGYLAVLVLALYIATDKAQLLYARRGLLWILCPLLLYWISYIWLTAHRGKMRDDPVVFAVTDGTSRNVILLLMATAILAL